MAARQKTAVAVARGRLAPVSNEMHAHGESPALKQVLEDLAPAVLAVDRAEALVEVAVAAERSAMRAAHDARNAAIAAAGKRLDAAKQAYAAAEAEATRVHEATVATVKRRVEDARLSRTAACERAAPLLKALTEGTARVASLAAASVPR